MTKIKLCGLSRPCDIETVNVLMPEYIGFVFARKSRRCISIETACALKEQLNSDIEAVGVFVNESPEDVAVLLNNGTINIAQLHGGEPEEYIRKLKVLTDKPVIKAFCIETARDTEDANKSSADYVLLDSGGGGTGSAFDWNLLRLISRPYFLAGGLDVENVSGAVRRLKPYAVDVSSGIESGGYKDKNKMAAFVAAVRKEDKR